LLVLKINEVAISRLIATSISDSEFLQSLLKIEFSFGLLLVLMLTTKL